MCRDFHTHMYTQLHLSTLYVQPKQNNNRLHYYIVEAVGAHLNKHQLPCINHWHIAFTLHASAAFWEYTQVNTYRLAYWLWPIVVVHADTHSHTHHTQTHTHRNCLLCTSAMNMYTYYNAIYRMAVNFGGEFILADWQFWEQSANISSAKTLQCAVINIRNHSFHVYNRPAAGHVSVIVGMEFTIHSCVRGYHVSKGFWTPEVGEELAC